MFGLIDSIQTRIRFMVQNAEILLNNGGQPQLVAALYIHAIEEFGKLVYVQSIEDVMGVVSIDMSNRGFRSHNLKIDLAMQILPSECFTLKQRDTRKTRLNQGRIPNMMCFPNLSFYDAEQWLPVNSVTLKSYLTMIQIPFW